MANCACHLQQIQDLLFSEVALLSVVTLGQETFCPHCGQVLSNLD